MDSRVSWFCRGCCDLDLKLAETLWSRGSFLALVWPYRDPLRGSLWVWFESSDSMGIMVRLFESRLLAEYLVVCRIDHGCRMGSWPTTLVGRVVLFGSFRASRDHGGLGWEPH